METRNCQNCKNDFSIEKEDFSFYEKIKVPPPTWCPECRAIRRLMWRNSRSLHKRSCGLCHKSLISMYKEAGSPPVYCTECWYDGDWDQLQNGKDYDFTKPFFNQLKELFQINPRHYTYKFGTLVNSEYNNYAANVKNAYLSFSIIDCEDILYSEIIDKSKNSMDSYACEELEGCYYNIDSDQNYNSHYLVKSRNCLDSSFLYDCANCSNCMLSSNLRNQQYVFRNKKLTREEYEKEVANLNLNTYTGLNQAVSQFENIMKNEAIHKYAFIYACQDAEGDHIHNAKNIRRSFDINDSENLAYCNRCLFAKDCMDCSGVGYGELIYEATAATRDTYMDFFVYLTIQGCRNMQYSLVCKNSSDCFGCVGLINKQYCIFNKQYTKEEYEELVPKIKKHMDEMPYTDSQGRVFKYGEFFPPDMCPFGVNESMSFDFFPMSKEKASEMGYPWLEREERNYNTTISSADLPERIEDVTDEILNEVIACPNDGQASTQCTGAYRIVPAELSFYRQENLPLPKFCPNCRHYKRLEWRGKMHLYDRECNCVSKEHNHSEKCGKKLKTPYAPERTEKIFCEDCYNKEVY